MAKPKNVSVLLDPDVLDKLRNIAQKNMRSVTSEIRWLITAHVDRNTDASLLEKTKQP